jgi:putative flippase GtrA
MIKLLRLSSFTILSGIGWCIDFAIFNYLVSLNYANLTANLISASVAVTFVLMTARRWIFRNQVGSLQAAVGRYVVWNIVAIAVASYLIKLIASGLDSLDLQAVIALSDAVLGHSVSRHALVSNAAKILVTPFTMYANFVAMGYIIERRLSFL